MLQVANEIHSGSVTTLYGIWILNTCSCTSVVLKIWISTDSTWALFWPESPNYFHINSLMLFAFFLTMLTLTSGGAEAVLCKIAGLSVSQDSGTTLVCYCILYHHGLTGKNSLISLQNVLNEAEFLILLNLDSWAHLFFLCDKMGSKCKIFLLHSEIMMVVSRKSTCEIFELATFFMERHLSLKEQLAHCGYSNLSTWQTLSQIEWNDSICCQW